MKFDAIQNRYFRNESVAIPGRSCLHGVVRWEVHRTSLPRDIRGTGGVHRDAVPNVGVCASKVAGVNERRPAWIDLRNEGVIITAPVRRLESGRGRWEVGGDRRSRHVRVSGGIDREAVGRVGKASAKIGEVNERTRAGCRGIEFGDESVSLSAIR